MTLINEKGFALLAAIIASLILLAVGMLAFSMSGGDQRASTVTVGDKKALAGTESGIHTLVNDFKPDDTTWTALNNYTQDCDALIIPSYIWRSIASGTDMNTQFAVCKPVASDLPPVAIAGTSLETWGLMRYDTTVVGRNTKYNSLTKVDVGIGFGPVPMK